MSRGPNTLCGVCQCTFCDSDCVAVNEDEGVVTFEHIIDPDEDNLFECGPTGAAVFMPSWLLNPPAVHAYNTGDQTMGHDTAQGLFFNEERYDTDNMYDKEAIDGKIIINTPGVYLVTLNCTWQKNSSGDRAAFIMLNGAEYLVLESKHAGDADLYVGHSLSVEHEFEAGDYLFAIVKQDSGADLRIESSRYSPIFAASFIRPPTAAITGS